MFENKISIPKTLLSFENSKNCTRILHTQNSEARQPAPLVIFYTKLHISSKTVAIIETKMAANHQP